MSDETDQHRPEADDAASRKPDLASVRQGDGQEYNDRDKLDFDPDDGLYTGTAIEGTTDIAGPHESDDDDRPIVERAAEMADGGTADEPDEDPQDVPPPEDVQR